MFVLEPRKTKRDSSRAWNMSGSCCQAENLCTDNHWLVYECFVPCCGADLWPDFGYTYMYQPSLSFETMVWMISSRCVLELKYGKAGIPVFFSQQASTRRTLPLMTTTPCLSVRHCFVDFWQNFDLPVLVALAGALGHLILLCSICTMPITQLWRAWLEGIKECGIGLVVCYTRNQKIVGIRTLSHRQHNTA